MKITSSALTSFRLPPPGGIVLATTAIALAAGLVAPNALARSRGHQAVNQSRAAFTLGSGGHEEIDDFADVGQCEVVDLNGAANGFYDHGDTVDLVKSFDVGNVIPAQLVISVGANVQGSFALFPGAWEEGTPSVTLFVPHETGTDVFRVVSGSVTITGLPSSGEAEFFFNSLIVSEVDNGSGAFVDNGLCFSFWDFTLDGVVSIPASWTCAEELYNNGTCHCGCGAVDTDCQGKATCEICGSEGSCAENKRGCGSIDPRNSGSCVEVPKKPKARTFDADIAPIIAARCAFCHTGAADITPVLDYAFMMSERSTNEYLLETYPEYADYDFNIVAGNLEQSLVWEVHIESGNMPPSGGLPADEQAVFEEWITQGALEN